jgi:hypothetical protein
LEVQLLWLLVEVVSQTNRIQQVMEELLLLPQELRNLAEATGSLELAELAELAVAVQEQQEMVETGRELLAEQGQPLAVEMVAREEQLQVQVTMAVHTVVVVVAVDEVI